jgi:hypothetical protein
MGEGPNGPVDHDRTPTRANRRRSRWREAVIIGAAVGLGVTAIFAVVVLPGDSNDRPKESAVSAGGTASTATTRRAGTTTTLASLPSAPSTSTSTRTSTTTRAAPAAVIPPTPRATAGAGAPVYTPVPLPPGVHATLTNCSWQPAGGGQYQAAGTLTNDPASTHGWTITIHWLQNGREVGQQSALVDLGVGQSKPWSLSMGAGTAPADPFSCALGVD